MNYTIDELISLIARNDEHRNYYRQKLDEVIAEVERAATEKAWDEGNEAGHESQSHWDGWRYAAGYPHENPYRREEKNDGA